MQLFHFLQRQWSSGAMATSTIALEEIQQRVEQVVAIFMLAIESATQVDTSAGLAC